MTGPPRELDGSTVPALLYGTAWKEQRTAELVARALTAGFRGIDTANQRKHYHEAEVGRALLAERERGTVRREDIFLQTKFTYAMGQDHRMPYDPDAPVAQQVEQSFASSLEHLHVDRVDSYLLHAPSQFRGLGAADVEAWRVMESLHDAGRARLLGVSNVAPEQLAELLRVARVRPAFVQNRCFAVRGWDAEMRRLCAAEGITYQGFSLLTANRPVVDSALVHRVAQAHQRTPAQVVLRFALQLGMTVLTGTTSSRHMTEDLAVFEFELADNELRGIERAAL